jgi:uncharacterized protein YdaU (DUF1376 family)
MSGQAEEGAMNYYERYCGDYQRDTAHLSLAEHGAYTMLLDTYFSVEKPLPEDLSSLYRVCRAMTRLEQQAVKVVAEQFFPVSYDDGLRHNQRADREIARARPKIEAARINGRKGGRPPRAASANTGEFGLVSSQGASIPVGLSTGSGRGMGGILPGTAAGTQGKPGDEAPQHQLQPHPQHQRQHELHSRHCQLREEAGADFIKPPDACETNGTSAASEPDSPGKGQSQGNGAMHIQDPGQGRDIPCPHHADSVDSRRGCHDSSRVDIASASGPVSPGISGSCCKALMSLGVTGCNPHHPTLLALLHAGATEEEFMQAAANAIARGKGSFPYVVGTVKRQREEAEKLVLHRGRTPNSQELLQAVNHAATAGWMPPELRNTERVEPADPGEVEFAEANGGFSSCR